MASEQGVQSVTGGTPVWPHGHRLLASGRMAITVPG
jgi:hypothetical protein